MLGPKARRAPIGTLKAVPHRKVNDPAKLRRLLDAVLMIEADLELSVLLRHLVEEACSLVDARYGALGVLNENRSSLDQFITVGLTEDQEKLIGKPPTGRGVLGLLITDPAPLRLDDLTTHPDSYGVPAHHPPMTSFLGVPVRSRNDVYGNLYLTNKVGAKKFNDEDQFLAEALATAAGIAVENTRLHERIRAVSVLEDRDRIAKDLHDRVIQRVFAVGVALQGATRLTDLAQMVEKVNEAVDGLEATMTEIRSAVYELGGADIPGGLRQGVLELAAELSPMLGARPLVTFSGPIDNAVPQRIADNLLAVLREALTNAGKHAQATRYVVTLTATDHVNLEVRDNGIGVELATADAGGMGLKNLRTRAEKLHGTFEVRADDAGGTRLTWRVPI
ncbi:MAG TPA: GAF domain-containing sensor histidine kinase [Acidimicrobiales bacterium]|nr:GAF domain-containing sensor histidine kinase [Acidimicrobiales bacterium]